MTVRSAGPVLSCSRRHPFDDILLVIVWTTALPGLSPEAPDIDVGRTVLTVGAEHRPTVKSDNVQVELSERPLGVFSRQVVLADPEHIGADHDAGVLTLRIPIAERAKPRTITIDEEARKEIGD
ncbi:Hsp20/alpha crystallin family protein [Streptomyces sp. NPDC055681]